MDAKQICQLVEERKQELFDLLCSLIKINSETFGSYGNEEECARYIYDLCGKLGLETEIYSPLDIEDFENPPDYFPGRAFFKQGGSHQPNEYIECDEFVDYVKTIGTYIVKMLG